MKCDDSNLNLGKELSREEVVIKPTYVKPQILKIDKVDLVTHGSKDLTDDSDTGGFQRTKEA